MTPGTRVRTRRHGCGTVIDTNGQGNVYHDWWPVWVRLDDAEPPWDVIGSDVETLEVIA